MLDHYQRMGVDMRCWIQRVRIDALGKYMGMSIVICLERC